MNVLSTQNPTNAPVFIWGLDMSHGETAVSLFDEVKALTDKDFSLAVFDVIDWNAQFSLIFLVGSLASFFIFCFILVGIFGLFLYMGFAGLFYFLTWDNAPSMMIITLTTQSLEQRCLYMECLR